MAPSWSTAWCAEALSRPALNCGTTGGRLVVSPDTAAFSQEFPGEKAATTPLENIPAYIGRRTAAGLPVAHTFNLQHDILQSWLHALTFGRNICAHHCRIWNRVFTIRPKIPKEYQRIWPTESHALLYVHCCVVWHMMKIIAPDSTWAHQLRELIVSRPNQISLASMGFPDDWATQPFWGLDRSSLRQ
jgi:hypothetical protein